MSTKHRCTDPEKIWIVVNGMTIIISPFHRMNESEARNKVENEKRHGFHYEAITVAEYERRHGCALTI